jgi:hypothetical protein
LLEVAEHFGVELNRFPPLCFEIALRSIHFGQSYCLDNLHHAGSGCAHRLSRLSTSNRFPQSAGFRKSLIGKEIEPC